MIDKEKNGNPELREEELLEQVLRLKEALFPKDTESSYVATERSGIYDHFDYSHYKGIEVADPTAAGYFKSSITNSDVLTNPYRVCDINDPDFENLMNELIDYSLNDRLGISPYYAFYRKIGYKENFVINIDRNMMYDISSSYASNGLPGLLSYIIGHDVFYRSVPDGQIVSARAMNKWGVDLMVDVRGFTNAGNYIYGIFSKYDKIMQDKSDALMERVSEWSNGKKDEHLDNVSDSLRNLLNDGV